jgi:hypothetical protein
MELMIKVYDDNLAPKVADNSHTILWREVIIVDLDHELHNSGKLIRKPL